MGPDRDTLLKDLRTNIIEIFFHRETGLNPIRISLAQKFLPPLFKNDPEQVTQMNEYHNNNPTLIGAWNMDTRHWVYLDVNTIAYVESKEDYY